MYTWDGAEWDLTAGRKYVWDGWRLLLELSVSGETMAVLRAYTWGLDLAGQAGGGNGPGRTTGASLLEGAGTIGGLLAVYDTVGTPSTGDDLRYVYAYDAQGNVMQVLDLLAATATLSIKARYEYDPYGNNTYIVAQQYDQPFCFSTKYFNVEKGLYNFGYRYYSPALGRWISRDPIEERGGVALYAFVANTPLVAIDPLGLQDGQGSCSAPTPQCIKAHMDAQNFEFARDLMRQYHMRAEVRALMNDIAIAAGVVDDLVSRLNFKVGAAHPISESGKCCKNGELQNLTINRDYSPSRC